MSATMTPQQIVDGLDTLRVLLSTRKEDIIATQEEARKQNALTAEVMAQAAEARSYIAQHASFVADIQRREETMAVSQSSFIQDHAKKVEEFKAHVDSENARLEGFSAQLNTRKSAQDAVETRQAAESARLASIAANHDREHQLAMTAVRQAEAVNKSIEAANLAESQRLKEWDTSLKAKAARLREQIANF